MRKLILTLSIVLVLLSIMTIGAFAKTFNTSAIPTGSPTVDGTVNESEYAWKSGTYTSPGTISGEFYGVGTIPANTAWDTNTWPDTDTTPLQLSDVQYFVSYDADYIYLAYKGTGLPDRWIVSSNKYTKNGYADMYFEFNPGLVENAHYYVMYTVNPVIGTADITATVNAAKGNTGPSITSTATGKAKYSGDLSVPTEVVMEIELKLSRRDLEVANGGNSFDAIGIRGMINCSNVEAMFSDKNDTNTYAAAWQKGWGAFHRVNLYPAEHTDHIFDETLSPLNASGHAYLCECGYWSEYADHILKHDWDTYPTLTNVGKVKFICNTCGYNTGAHVDYIPEDGHLLGAAYNQNLAFVPAAVAAPTLDGKIHAGEYDWALEDVSSSNLPTGTYKHGTLSELSKASFYFSYDAKNVYFAAKVSDSGADEWNDYLWINFGGDATDTGDAWRVFIRPTTEIGISEFWKITDGVSATTTKDAVKTVGKTYGNGVYTYEASFDRATWGLDSDKIFVALEIWSDGGNERIVYASNATVAGHSKINGMIPNVFFLGDKDAIDKTDYFTKNYFETGSVANCAEGTHTLKYVNCITKHRQICTVCGYATEAVDHTKNEAIQPIIVKPTYYAKGSCDYGKCGVCQLDYTVIIPQLIVPSDQHLLLAEAQKQYFLGAAAQVAPKADGVVTPGEYSFGVKEDVSTTGNNATSPKGHFYVVDNTSTDYKSDTDEVAWYMSYDEKYVYAAIEIYDTYTVADTTAKATFAFYTGNGVYDTAVVSYALVYTRGGELTCTNVSKLGETGKYTAVETEDGKVTFEIAIERSIFGNARKLFIKHYFVLDDKEGNADTSTGAKGGSATTGFTSAPFRDLMGKTGGGAVRLPHVVFFGQRADFVEYANEVLDEVTLTHYPFDANHDCDYEAVIGDDISHTRVCTVCGHTVKDEFVEPEFTIVNKTYHATTCSVCNESVYAMHTPVVDKGFAAVCVRTGLTDGSHCSVCLGVIAEREEIPATGIHRLDSGKITTAPTCSATGVNTITCLDCEGIIMKDLPVDPDNHTYDDGVETVAPTCTEAGEKVYTCTGCGVTKTEAVEEKGHTWVDADCTTPKTCSDCGETEGEALGHSYDNDLDTDCNVCGEIREVAGTDEPETDAPETDAPETDAPETDAPETDAPETDAPETDAPETDAPETDAPETDAPETDAPETDAPETDAPETDAPETDAPETDAPETDAPETDAPEAEKNGCKSSIAAIGVALVAALGTCTAFISKKR